MGKNTRLFTALVAIIVLFIIPMTSFAQESEDLVGMTLVTAAEGADTVCLRTTPEIGDNLVIPSCVPNNVTVTVSAPADGSPIVVEDLESEITWIHVDVQYGGGIRAGYMAVFALTPTMPADFSEALEAYLENPEPVLEVTAQIIVPVPTGEATASYAFVLEDTPVYAEAALTNLVGEALTQQSFPIVSQTPTTVEIALSNNGDTGFISVESVQIAERDDVDFYGFDNLDVFEIGQINGCPTIAEWRDFLDVELPDGSSARNTPEWVPSEYCTVAFSSPVNVVTNLPIGMVVEYNDENGVLAGLGAGQRVTTRAATFRARYVLPETDPVNAEICEWAQRSIDNGLNRPESERFMVTPVGLEDCGEFSYDIPEDVNAAAALAAAQVTFTVAENGCPILGAGVAENEDAEIVFERVDHEGWFSCVYTYDEDANVGTFSFTVPDGVVFDTEQGRFCAGMGVERAYGGTWYWDENPDACSAG